MLVHSILEAIWLSPTYVSLWETTIIVGLSWIVGVGVKLGHSSQFAQGVNEISPSLSPQIIILPNSLFLVLLEDVLII